jgi:hypothetical protein
MLRRDPAKPLLQSPERPDWRLGLPGGRLGEQGQRQDRRFSLGSGGSPAYDSDLRSDRWEIPAEMTLFDRTTSQPPARDGVNSRGPTIVWNTTACPPAGTPRFMRDVLRPGG